MPETWDGLPPALKVPFNWLQIKRRVHARAAGVSVAAVLAVGSLAHSATAIAELSNTAGSASAARNLITLFR
ncbi:hypothetical protein SM11_pC0407 (plasmid) [Sinorhizobium meliloti SM11]|uniref:Uncharacterized protein n=1 Tax=Sinorhizobium meliloti (strain SM11) TaxID=707241 RepID=F7XCS0_SINMM|nr:hypothetical protein SM11_pC0407 [Sinorhizobium meliloti SM11]